MDIKEKTEEREVEGLCDVTVDTSEDYVNYVLPRLKEGYVILSELVLMNGLVDYRMIKYREEPKDPIAEILANAPDRRISTLNEELAYKYYFDQEETKEEPEIVFSSYDIKIEGRDNSEFIHAEGSFNYNLHGRPLRVFCTYYNASLQLCMDGITQRLDREKREIIESLQKEPKEETLTLADFGTASNEESEEITEAIYECFKKNESMLMRDEVEPEFPEQHAPVKEWSTVSALTTVAAYPRYGRE